MNRRKSNIMKTKYLILFIGVYLLVNLSLKNHVSKVQTSIQFVITFVEGTSFLDDHGSMLLDSLGKSMRCNEEFSENLFFVFTAHNSEKEYSANKCIGLERYRVVIDILKRKYKQDVEFSFFYRDREFYPKELFRNQTGLELMAYGW